MKVSIDVGDEIQQELNRVLSKTVRDAVAELNQDLAGMKQEMENFSEEMRKLRKGFQTAIDPWAYKNFFDEVSTNSRLLVEKMRKYLDEMIEREK